jgi:hypothetical protein
MFGPFRVYRELASEQAEPGGPWVGARRPLAWLAVLGGFVSLTAAGRLVWFHLLFGTLAWVFVPLLQIGWLALALAVVSRPHLSARSIDLFYVGQAPWLLFLLGLAGVCLFAPEAWATFQWLLASQILAVALLAAAVWSVLLTFAFFRGALCLEPRRAWFGMSVYYLGFAATVATYYVVTGQLLPLVVGSA